MRSADDYLQYVAGALDEAKCEIDSAATVFVESEEAKQKLGESLGQARNALTRARRDLDAHIERESRRDDRSAAEAYFKSLRLFEGSLPHIVVAIVPLPIEEERISLETLAERTFPTDFTNWVTRFNLDERRNTPAKYLSEAPGQSGGSREQDHFRFDVMPLGGTKYSQLSCLYQSGGFVFKKRLYSSATPPHYAIGLVMEEVRTTIKFAWRLYEELRIIPRSVAVQSAITKVDGFHLKTPVNFAGLTDDWLDWLPNEGVIDIAAPHEPIVLPFSGSDAVVQRVLPAVESAVQSWYTRSS